MKRIGIVGGGPAGLGLAHELAHSGYEVQLFEAGPQLGGLAGSFRLGDLELDRYYHFICQGDAGYLRWLDRLGLSARVGWTATKMGFFHAGKMHALTSAADLLRCDALAPSARVRYGAFTLHCALRTDWKALDRVPAARWLVRRIGSHAYDVLWHPLLALKFHQDYSDISAAWVWHRIHRVATSRGRFLQRERFGFVEGGTAVFTDAVAARARAAGARLHTRAPVRRIIHDGLRCTGLQTEDGTCHDFDRVVSTVPLPVFTRLAGTPEVPFVKRLRAIDYIGVVCVVLRLRHRLTQNYWLNVNDPRVPFNGCIEYTNLNTALTNDGTSVLYVPYYMPTSHPRFGWTDEHTIAETVAALRAVQPRFSDDWVIDAAVARDPHAQVVCTTGFRDRIPPHRTVIRDLWLVESSQLYPADRSISATLDLCSVVYDAIRSEDS